MSGKLKAKIGVLVAVALASLACMGALLYTMQSNLQLESCTYDMRQELEELNGLLEAANAEQEQVVSTYDAVYQSKADSVAFMANNNTGFEATDAKMQECKNLLGVDNVMVVGRDGGLVAQAQDTQADFSLARYNQLRTVFENGEPSAAMEVELPDEGRWFRYYAAQIDDSTMAVVEQNPEELYRLIDETSSKASVLGNIGVGEHGYVFAVSAKTYEIEHHPSDLLTGADAIDAGIEVKNLEDGFFGWMDLDGERLYCGVSKIGDTYYVAAVPESDMVSSRVMTVGVILFVFFAVLAVVIMYGVFVMREDERSGHVEEDYANLGPVRFNKAVGKKAAVLSFMGFLAVVLISFYMQTLFALSSESTSGGERAADMEATIARYNEQADELTAQYGERYLSKAQAAAYILEQNPALATREKMQELADVLQIQYVFDFNAAGEVVATNSPYANFTLSEDPADQSYEFRKLLQGVDHLVQDPRADEVSGELRQYIGATIYGDDGAVEGFVQLGIRPERLENMLANVRLDSILDGVKVGQNGFAFAVSKEDGTFSYYPDSRLAGKAAAEFGMEEGQLKGGYSDYLTIDGERYFATSLETDQHYVYIAEPEADLMTERGPMAMAVGALSLLCQVVIFLLVSFEVRPSRRRPTAADAAGDGDDADERMFEVTMPSGRRAKTESAASRWLNRSLAWDEKTAEQKTLTVVRWLVAVFAIAVCAAVLLQDQLFEKNSIFAYILGGSWERGLNIFAITASAMTACVALTLVMVAQQLLKLLSSVFGARGETVCRMLASFIKYAAVIAILYYCLALVGVDTTTLLASAGILSIAISFGAKELVSDIISGLFIIFEGEFRVGDIISVGSKSGTVVEIGVRTTKIEDGSKNVIVIRNSEVSDVVNMTKKSSFASCDVGIEYGESLERVESILEKEFPNIRRRLPAIEDGPFYKGIVALADNSVNIRIIAQCAEGDRGQLERDLRREMKLIFDEYDISIPFPQVVVNQPKEYQEATLMEQLRADRFNAQQKEATKDFGEDEGERR